MRKLLIALLVIAFVVACGGEEKKAQADVKKEEPAVTKPSIEVEMAKNIRAQLEKGGLNQIQLKVTELKKLDFMPGYSFVKVDLSDPNTGRKQVQYFFTDGRYLVADIVDSVDSVGLMDSYQFEYAEKTDIDLSKLSLYEGNKEAPNTIVVISDFQCPYCKKAHTALKAILENNKKDVAVYFMHMPLPFHKKADVYSRIFEAGLAMGKNFADELYATTPEYDKKSDDEIIADYAAKTDDAKKFRELVASDEVKQKVQENSKMAQELGVRGTPHIFFNGKAVGGFKPNLYEIAVKSFK